MEFLETNSFELIVMGIKMILIVILCLQIPAVMVWFERRVSALIQRRRGPNRVGLFRFRFWGLLQSFVDTIKLIFKEEVVPSRAHSVFFHIAPIFVVFPIFLAAGAIPYGPPIELFGKSIPLTLIRIDVGFLFILAVSGLGVYGAAIGGWSTNNKYALLGSLRASAQMISYEIPLALSLVPLVLIFKTLDLTEIVLYQENFLAWGIFVAPVSFFLFLICMFAETSRAPFDLSEGESEIVAGFHTEYGSTKFATYFLAEYVMMFVLSCLAAIFFFGGWQLPFVSQDQLRVFFDSQNISSFIGVFVLLLKAAFFMLLYIWVRWTLPRFRYDQLMKLGWQFMLPLGLINIVLTAIVLAVARF